METSEEKKEIKRFNLSMDKDLWWFLKMTSLENECSMADIVINNLEKQRKRAMKKVTSTNASV